MQQQTTKQHSDIVCFVRSWLDDLMSNRATGKYEITLECNLSQGGIGDVFVKKEERSRLMVKK